MKVTCNDNVSSNIFILYFVELISLDLSGTGVGNKMILQCIVKMEQLKSIKLNDDSIKVKN